MTRGRTSRCITSILAMVMTAHLAAEPLTTALAYQGQLRQDGEPLDGSADLTFTLFDAEIDGNSIGVAQEMSNATIVAGLFTVELDFGPDAFAGDQRWLQVAVRSPHDPGDTQPYTVLSPRQPLTAAPYALFARSVPNPLDLENSANGIAVIRGVAKSNNNNAVGVLGRAENGTAATFGVRGEATSTNGTAVFGLASATSGATFGVRGESSSTSGTGVRGVVPAASGITCGVHGESASAEGRGVYGLANSATGFNYGVYGESPSTSGSGVFGFASDTTGTNYGGQFYCGGSSGRGVYASAYSATGNTYGGFFESASDAGRAVWGRASATTGTTYGGDFESDSATGTGVRGRVENFTEPPPDESTAGVRGESEGPQGRGVYGIGGAYGGYFTSPEGIGLFAECEGLGTGVYGRGDSYGGYFTSAEGVAVRGWANGPTAGTAIHGRCDAAEFGRGVFGWANGPSGINWGVYGLSVSTEGRGVCGVATASSGSSYGVYGESESSSGTGVYGIATAETGAPCGGYFETPGPGGTGVKGIASDTNGNTFGGDFRCDSPNGIAVRGYATATSGFPARAVVGETDSEDGQAVYGLASATTGANVGGYFAANGTPGTGVQGFCSSVGYGGHFVSFSGVGVFGWVLDDDGATIGGDFESESTSGTGVRGLASADSGTNYGVFGVTNSPDGYAGYFDGRGYFSGNVGIGTLTPTEALTVNGDINLLAAGFGAIIGALSAEIELAANMGDGSGGVRIEHAGSADIIIDRDDNDSSRQFRVMTDGLDRSTATTLLIITEAGDVGIGDLTPDAALDVVNDGGIVAQFNRDTNDGTLISLAQAGVQEGSISVSGTTVSYNAFTGSHFAWTDQPIARGMLVTLTGINRRYHDDPESEIVYGITPASTANDSRCMGAYLGLLEPSQPAGPDNPHLVMAVGNGEMCVIDTGVDIQPGDWLISSDVPGCAKKHDPQQFPLGYIVARAAEGVDWTTIDSPDGGAKRTRVSVFFDSFQSGSESAATEQLRALLRQQGDDIAALRLENADFKARLARLEQIVAQPR